MAQVGGVSSELFAPLLLGRKEGGRGGGDAGAFGKSASDGAVGQGQGGPRGPRESYKEHAHSHCMSAHMHALMMDGNGTKPTLTIDS